MKAVGYSSPVMPIMMPDLHTGHFVPSKGKWRKFLHEYMMDPFADIPSPGLSSTSVPTSGRGTPVNGRL
jgi:hypothetical protein